MDIGGAEERVVARRTLRSSLSSENKTSVYPAGKSQHTPSSLTHDVSFEKCFPHHPLKILSGTLDYSWVECQ